MSRKRNKSRNARQNTAAEQALHLAERDGNTALVVAQQGAVSGVLETVAMASGNPVEGGFSTTSPEIYPEAMVEKSPATTAGNEAQADKWGRPTVLDDNAKTLACTLLSVGLSRRQAAAYADVSHTTTRSTMRRTSFLA